MKTLEQHLRDNAYYIRDDIDTKGSTPHLRLKDAKKAVKDWLKDFLEHYQMDSMEESVYVTTFEAKLEGAIQ